MEVHTHTQTSDPGIHRGRKKWTHYFWEFIMLFLAVFCGFMAENQREHMVEHKRELKYVKSMIDDLKADTAFFLTSIGANSTNHAVMDSLINELKLHNKNEPTNHLYQMARMITAKGVNQEYNNSAFEQLINSGNMRLIRSHGLLDSIRRYYQSLNWIDGQMDKRNERLNQLLIVSGELFDGWTMKAVMDSGFRKLTRTPPLIIYDKGIINKYITSLVYFKSFDLFLHNRTKREFLPEATRLIQLLQKEYHLE
jgi:hypothetical protein